MNAEASGDLRRIVLVTGAAHGIGAAVVECLVARGDRVVALDIDAEGLECATQGSSLDGSVVPIVADVSDHAAIEQTVRTIERDVGPIDALAHAAGILRAGPIATLPEEAWNALMRVNFDGLRYTARAVATVMLPRKRGSIVSIASNAATVPRVNMAAYAASKAAALMFVKCLALELAPHLRCNIVSPGSTDTAMQRAYVSRSSDSRAVVEGSLSAFRTGIPLGRIAAPQDIAAAVAFLLSEDARHITMTNLCVDGGATLGVP